ncbi:MAG: MFS transporter [Parvibaculum sp.]|nr:MFS transporter [Parvibaculum sp.]|tara:strand:+ start:1424 stop:2701 length:1278 start_codon:yes stop_codon:yes gene_type:complete
MTQDELPVPRAGYLHGWFYGWYVVAAILVVLAVGSGLGFYNLSVFLKAFVSHGGFTVASASTATACFFIASGFTGLVVGAMIERYDVRWMITAGALICGGSMFAAAHVHELWQLYAFYALFGAGYSACALLPCTTLIARWFTRQRSQALSIGSTGLSLGGILLTPLSAKLIATSGLDGAAPWLALIMILGIIPITWLVIRPSPLAFGIGPDGDPILRDDKGVPLMADGIGFDEAVRSRFFVLMTLTFIFAMMAQVGTIAHLFSLVAGRTGSEDTAAAALATMAAASVVGRLVGGWALAYMSSRGFVVGLVVAQAIVLVLFAFAATPTALLGVSVFFGFTVGNLLMMAPLLSAEAFGLKAYGRIFSINQLCTVAGVASGPVIMGQLFGIAGGYDMAFLSMAIASALAFFCIWAAGPVRALLDGQTA